MSFFDEESQQQKGKNLTVERNFQLDDLTENIEELAHLINRMKRILDTADNIDDEQFTKVLDEADTLEDAVQRKLLASRGSIYDKMKRDFGSLKDDLRTIQNQWRRIQTLKSRKSAKTVVASTSVTSSGDVGYVSINVDEETPLKAQSQVQMQIQKQQSTNDMAVQQELDYQTIIETERHEDITRIHDAVGEVNAIFKQLGTLVSEQGEQIDTIEANIGGLRDDAEAAHTQLERAEQHQRSKSRCSLWFLMILFVILLFVLLIS